MTSMFDYDDSVNLAYKAKQAGKSLVTAKHDLLDTTGEFLFLAHSDREFALRCQMVEKDIEKIAFRRLASVSDSKAKLVHAAYDEWKLRHASCEMCKVAKPKDPICRGPECSNPVTVDRSNRKGKTPFCSKGCEDLAASWDADRGTRGASKFAVAEREGDTASEAYRGGADEAPGAPVPAQRSETAPLHRDSAGVCKTCGGKTQSAGDYQCKDCEFSSILKGQRELGKSVHEQGGTFADVKRMLDHAKNNGKL